MEFRILGPVEVRDGDRVVSIHRRKHRALLAILILRANTIVTTDVLLEELWGGDPPRTARQALHNYVSLLRKELGADVLETHDQGYVLHARPEQIDARRFEVLMAEGKFAEALSLWRGPALADLAYEPFAELEARRLDELRLNAREDLIDADLERGRHEALIAELETLVSEHPYRERLRSQLMLALYRSGRQVDALEAYRSARRTLIELGLEPSEALRALEQAVLRQDASLGLGESAARRATVTVLVCELELEPAGLDPEHVRARLVRAMTEARAAVELHGGSVELLAGDELLAVFGGPERAVRAAGEIRQAAEFRVGIATGEALVGRGFVSGEVVFAAKRLAREADAGEVLLDDATLDRTKGVADDAQPPGVEPLTPLVGRERELAALRDAYANAPRLVTLIGEQGIGKTRLARELANSVSDEATVLVGRCSTSGEGATLLPLREMLLQSDLAIEALIDEDTTVGEQLLEVRRALEELAHERPLVLVFDDAQWAEPTLLELVKAWKLEAPVLTIWLTWPGYRVIGERIELGPLADDEVRRLVDNRSELVAAAAGNPLFAEQLLTYAEHGAADSVPPSIEALIAARLQRLDPDQRSVLRRAAVIGQTFSRAAVHDLGLPGQPVPSLLVALAEQRFVRRLRAGWRFHHPLVREVTYASLPKEERAELHERYADWLDERGEPEELVGHHLEQASRHRLELKPKDPGARRLAADAGLRLGAAGIAAWKRGDAAAAANLLGRATSLLQPNDPRRIEYLCELGPALRTRGELVPAVAILEQAIALATAAGDRRIELRARLELEVVRLFTEPRSADELLEIADAALPVFGAVEDYRSLGRAWLVVATVEGPLRNNFSVGRTAAERALSYYARAGWPTPRCVTLISSCLFQGPTPVNEAVDACAQLADVADRLGRANVLANWAPLEAMRGRFDDAQAMLATARSIFDDLGQTAAAETDWRPAATYVQLLAGDYIAAEHDLRESCAVLEASGDLAYLGTRAAELADLLVRTRREEEADRWCEVASRSGAVDDVQTQAGWRSARARILARRGVATEAHALANEAVGLTEATDHLNQRAHCLLSLAEVLRTMGRIDKALEAAHRATDLYARKENVIGMKQAQASLVETPAR